MLKSENCLELEFVMKHNENVQINQITEGVIWKQLLLFFFPIVFGTFFQQLYNTVDTMVVGHYVGKDALACVGGSAAQITNLIICFYGGLSSGAAVIVSQFYGAKNEEAVHQGLHTAFAFSIIGSILIGVLGYALVPSMLRMMNTPAELMSDTVLYLRIYFSSILFVFLFNAGSAMLRAAGDSKNPLYYLIICCIVNIVLDIVFVGGLHMGVAGAAWATWIAQAISAGLVLWKLMSAKSPLRLSLSALRIHPGIFRSQIEIGLPTGIQASLFCISNILVQAALNTFGTDIVAAWSVYGRLDAVYWMVSGAFGIAITTFVGQNYGAGKHDRIRKSVSICLAMDLFVSTAIVLFLLFFRTPLFGLFTTDANVVAIGADMLLLITPYYIFYAFIEVFSGARKGVGDVMIPMMITLFGTCFLRVAWVIVCMYVHPTVDAIILCYPVTWVLCAVLFILYYMKKRGEGAS